MTHFLVGVFLWFMVRAAIVAAVAWLLWLVAREWTAPWRRNRTRRRLLREAVSYRHDGFEPMTPEAMEARGWLAPEAQLQQQMDEEW